MIPNDNAAYRPIGMGSLGQLAGGFNIARFTAQSLARQVEADQQDRVLAVAQGKAPPPPRVNDAGLAIALPFVNPDRLPGGKAAGSNTTGSKAIMAAAVASGVPAFVDPRTGQAADLVKVSQAAPVQIVASGTAATGPTGVSVVPTAAQAYDTYARAASKLGVQVAAAPTPAPPPAAVAVGSGSWATPPAPAPYQAPMVQANPAPYQDPYAQVAPPSYSADPYAGQYADPYAGQYADPYADPYAGSASSWGDYGNAWGNSWGDPYAGVYGMRGLGGFSFGNLFKTLLPVAASFIPGVGGVVASAVGAIGSGSAGTAPSIPSVQPPAANPPAPTATTPPSFWSGIGQAVSQAVTQLIPVASQALMNRLNQQQAETGTLPPGYVRLSNGQIAQVANTQVPAARPLNPAGVRPVGIAPTTQATTQGQGLQLSPAMLAAGALFLVLAMKKGR